MNLVFLESFLLWCSIINISILLVWFLAFVFARESLYSLHHRWFKISNDKFDAIHYTAMAYWKLSVFLFNLVPYIALRIIID